MKSMQEYEVSGLSLQIKVSFLDKKKQISEYNWNIGEVEKNIERINESKLVVFNVKDENKRALINALAKFTVMRKQYSPIVEVGNEQVFLFPQLNYSDIYLLMSIFQKKYPNETISTNLGIN